MKIFVCFLGLFLLSGSVFATDLTLTDGRVLKDAKIMSQTPLTVIIKHAAALSSASKNLLPPELRAQYPINGTAAREAELKSQLAYNKARGLELAETERVARLRAQHNEIAPHGAGQPDGKEKSKYENAMSDVQKRAEDYFNTEYAPVNQAKNISKVSVKVSELRLVDGWDKRWFVRGKCDIESYEVVQEYPYYSPKVVQRAARHGEMIEADDTPHDVANYTTQTRNFEAYYSTENGRSTFDVTLR